MEKFLPCPFCGELPSLIVSDDEGNIHSDGYEDDPWSGLCYQIDHSKTWDSNDTYRCPIVTHEDEVIGSVMYTSKEEAISTWNRRFNN